MTAITPTLPTHQIIHAAHHPCGGRTNT